MSTLLHSPPAQHAAVPGPGPHPRPARGHPLALLASALCLWVALLAGMASLNGVVQGFGWLFTLWFPVLLIHLAGALVRGSALPDWLAPIACALVAAASLWLQPALRDPALGTGAVERFGQILQDATLEFATQVPEVAFTRSVDFVFLLLALVLAVLVELLASARRLAPLVVLPLAFAPVIASLFKLSGAGAWYLVVLLAAMVGYFAFLPYVWPGPFGPRLPGRRQLGFAGLLAAVSSLVLVASSVWMPGFRQGMFPEGSRPSGDLFASNIDPLLNLGRDLRSNNPSTVLSYYTSAKTAPYLRTDVIDDLSAERWEPDKNLPERDFTGATALREQYMSFGAVQELTELQWEQIPKNLKLPLPLNSYLIQGIAGDWHWQPETATATFDESSRQATSTVLVSHSVPQLTAALARNFVLFERATPELPDSLLQLPEDPDGSFHALLQQHLDLAYGKAGVSGSKFDIAVDIQNYLRSSQFTYSEQTPLREGYDGANRKVITAFLDRRQGYCVHFASTMAVMARAAGIPSRIVVGYAPGEPTGQSVQLSDGPDQGTGQEGAQIELRGYRVSGRQAHSWPELYLPGLGWTPFEPTPGRGVTPDYAPVPESETASDPTLNDNRPLPGEPTPSPSANSPTAAGGPQASGDRAPIAGILAGSLIPLLVLALAAAPLLRRRARAARWQQLQAGGSPATQALWDELRALGTDYRQGRRPGETEGQYCRRLAEAHPHAAQQLRSLAQVMESSFYAGRHLEPGAATEVQRDLEVLRLTLCRDATWAGKLRAALFPLSLRPGRWATPASRVTSRS